MLYRMSVLSCPWALQVSQQLNRVGSLHPPGIIIHFPLEINLSYLIRESPNITYIFLADTGFLCSKSSWLWIKQNGDLCLIVKGQRRDVGETVQLE